ncbi:MAG TPA: LysR family transcriptional regulator [Burkholderiaceae bacterium]
MDRIQEMTVFAAVAEAQSFAGAARALGVSAATVTRAVAELERRLGTLLVLRDTRRLRLTDAGSRFATDVRRLLQELQEAEESAAGLHAAPRGQLVVTAPQVLGDLHVVPVMTDYLAAHPGVSIRALLVDRVVSLMDEGVDVAVRIGPLPDSSMTALPVGEIRRVVVASPGYLARRGTPGHPDALAGHATISAHGRQQGGAWGFRVDGRAHEVIVPSRLAVNSFRAAIHAASSGAGLTQVASYQVAQAVAEGRLRVVLADFEVAPLPVHVVWAEGRRGSGKVRSFVDFCAARLRAALAGPARLP